MRKLKFFLLGLVPGLLIVFFILNKKGASCSGYLPNSRVVAETLSKKFTYAPALSAQMATEKIDEKFLRDSIITNGEIDFKRSHPRQKPCPEYVLVYPKKNPKYEISFQKCEEEATLQSLKRLR